MQYQIIKLCMNMIEMEWNRVTADQKPKLPKASEPMTLKEYTLYLEGEYNCNQQPTYVAKLACTYWWLNKLMGHF